ncbi:MAG: leucine-rich repeat protein, partial [Methanomassiliicoccales archaeon]
MEKKTGTYAISTIFVLLMLVGASFFVVAPDTVAAAQDGAYTYTVGSGVATLTGYTGTGGSITVPPTLGGFPTRTIGARAFYACTSITSVTIPTSVTSMGTEVFSGCTALTSVTIPGTVNSIGSATFRSCTSLTSVAIGNGITSIGSYAFNLCSALTSVTLPSSVTSIYGGAFEGCASLTSVNIPSSVTAILDSTFKACTSLTSVTIPNGITTIGTAAFASCGALVDLTIGGGVTSIGGSAFISCTSLTSVTIPNGVTTIGSWGFAVCTSLTSITFLGLVAPTSVGASWIENTPVALRGHALHASNFPAPWINAGDPTFNGLKMGAVKPATSVPEAPTRLSAAPGDTNVVLTWSAPSNDGGSPVTGYKLYRSSTSNGVYTLITSPSGLTYTNTGLTNNQTYWYKVSAVNAIGEGNGSSPISATPMPEEYTYTVSGGMATITGYIGPGGAIAIPSTLGAQRYPTVAIKEGAFKWCHSLTSVTISSSIQTIGRDAFNSCNGLTSVIIHSGSIGASAFDGCPALTSVTIGNGVTSIGASAFDFCPALTSLIIGEHVSSIGDGAFARCTALTSVTIPN